jgi:flagellin
MDINPLALSMSSYYQRSKTNLEASMMRLSTGDKAARLGSEPAANVSISQKFRHKIKAADASIGAMQMGISFLNHTDAKLQDTADILVRMQELAASSADGMKDDQDREAMDLEFELLRNELGTLSREGLYNGMQTIGRDAVVSYDAIEERITFWQPGGGKESEISVDFGSGDKDADGTTIGFSSSEDFMMSRDGRSLYYLGTVSGDGAGVVRLKKYDIETNRVYTGSDLYTSADKMFVDEDGEVYVNGSSTLYGIDESTLTRTATLVTDMTASTEFSVYKDNVYYYRNSDNRIVYADVATATPTTLTGAIVFGAGDHTFSGSGKYVADENAAGQIRVIDTATGNSATLAIGAANSVMNLAFSEDGDRLYYVNKVNNSINYISVDTDTSGNVTLSSPTKLVQGVNSNSFNGLSLNGTNNSSIIEYMAHQDAPSMLEYESADISLYALGIANTRIDTQANSGVAITELREAVNRLNAQRAKIGAQASRMAFALDSHREYIGNLSESESMIRDVDVAQETSRLVAQQVQNQVISAVLSQFNSISQNVLRLLQ